MGIYWFLLIILVIQLLLVSVYEEYEEKNCLLRVEKNSYFTWYVSIQKVLFFIDSVFMIIIASYRHVSVGTDTKVYTYWFEILKQYSFNQLSEWVKISRIELGTGALAKLGIVLFGNNIVGAWIVIYTLIFMCLGKFISYFSKNEILSLFLFLTFSLYNQTFNIVGQCMAAAILVIATIYAQKKDYKRFLCIVGIAFLIHKSAVIGLIIYPLTRIEKEARRNSLVIVGVSYVLSKFASIVIPIIVSHTSYSYYLYWEQGSESGVGLFINLAIFICFLVFYERMGENANIWLYMSAITLALNFFIGYMSMLGRLMVYFKLFYIVSIPIFINGFEKKINRQLISVGIIVLFSIYYFWSIYFGTCFETVPYIFRQ